MDILWLIGWMVIIGVCMWGLGRIPMAEPFRTIAYVLAVIFAVVLFFHMLGMYTGHPMLRLPR